MNLAARRMGSKRKALIRNRHLRHESPRYRNLTMVAKVVRMTGVVRASGAIGWRLTLLPNLP
jgi:hypothetical protein